MTDFPNYEAPPNAQSWDREMERMIGQWHPGRHPSDFQPWSDELRRQHGHRHYGVLRRAVSMMLVNDDLQRLPKATTMGTFLDQAEKQLAWEAQERPALPAPPPTGYTKPAPEVIEYHLARGMAIQKMRREGTVSEPTDADIREIIEQRRKMNIPVGQIKPVLTRVGERFK